MAPLLERQLPAPRQAKAVCAFPVPVGGFGDPAPFANWMLFMLSDATEFLCGSVVFVDRGSDAYFRADDWPQCAGAATATLPEAVSRSPCRPRHA